MSEPNDILWEEIVAREGKTFVTHKGKAFTYHIKRPKSGETSGEIVIDRRAVVITRATMLLAYHGALEAQQKRGCVDSPRRLGAYGDVYLYPIFLEIGVCGAHPGDPVRNLDELGAHPGDPVRDLAEIAAKPEPEVQGTDGAGMKRQATYVEAKTSEMVAEPDKPMAGEKRLRHCEKCGFTTEEDFDFCPKCGSRLNS